MTHFSEYTNYDGLGLAELVRKKEVTETELLEAAMSAAAKVDPQINAIVFDMAEQAAQTIEQGIPEGAFAGVPFMIKDFVINYAGVPTTHGCRLFEGLVPDHDSELMARFKKAGLVTFAKTATSEVGFNGNTEAVAYKNKTCNPWDTTRTASGSSGGSAAAVAAGIVPMAHGNDGGGSIRMPASVSGIFGMKPSRGRVPLGPDMNNEAMGCLPVELVVSRSVRDTAAILDAVAGPDIGASLWAPVPERSYLSELEKDPRPLRIAFMPDMSDDVDVHPDCIAALDDAVKLCTDLGHEMVEASLKIDRSAFVRAWCTIMVSWVAPMIDGIGGAMGRTPSTENLEWVTWSLLQHGRELKAVDLVGAQMLFNGLSRQVGTFFEDYDMILTPTVSQPPFKSGELNQNEEGMDAFEFMDKGTFSFCHTGAIFNATGHPAMSVPLYWSDENLPIGVQFVGSPADESRLFQLAGQLERARPWKDRRPPICA